MSVGSYFSDKKDAKVHSAGLDETEQAMSEDNKQLASTEGSKSA